MERLITLSDGTSMGGSLIIFKTNAPKERLKELEQLSCDVFINNGSAEDVPNWADKLFEEGYLFEYVDEHGHITPFNSSNSWLEMKYPQITEHYIINDQPNL
jgi:hypothetical protein